MIKIELFLKKSSSSITKKTKAFCNRCNSSIFKKGFWLKVLISVIINAIFICIVYKKTHLRFIINDDYAFNLFLSGAYGGQTGYTVFQNIVLGKIIVMLYKLIPTINWYAIVLIGTLYVSFVIFHSILLDKFGYYIGILIQIFTMAIFLTMFLLNLQWTLCAYICLPIGIISMIHGYESKGVKRIFLYSISGILFIQGYMIRMNILLPILAYMLGYLFVMLITDKKKATNLAIFFVIINICFCILFNINKFAYNSEQIWKEYMQFNLVRSNLIDYGAMDYDMYKDTFESVNWSRSDHAIFYGFMIPDEEKFNTDNLQRILKAKQNNKFNFNVKSIRKQLVDGIKEKNTLFVFYIILIATIICITFNKNKFMPLALFFSSIGFHIAFIVIKRPIFRVIYPHYVLVALILIYMIDIKEIKRVFGFRHNINRMDLYKSSAMVLSVVILLSLKFTNTKIVDWNATIENFYKSVNDKYKIKVNAIRNFDLYVKEHPENIYIMAPKNYSPRNLAYSILESPKKESLENFFHFGGWETRTKYYYEFKKRNGINNILKDLIEKDNFYIAPLLYKDEIVNYIEENYKYKVDCKEIENIDGIKIYKFCKKDFK